MARFAESNWASVQAICASTIASSPGRVHEIWADVCTGYRGIYGPSRRHAEALFSFMP